MLVATMGQEDCSLTEKMSIKNPAVIANQCGRWSYDETSDGKVRMISTDTIGVGINRNFGLQLARGDILVFADDDLVYYDGSLQGVLDAFQELPDADVIFFGLDMTKGGEIYERRRHPQKQLHIWNSLKFGAARMAIRRSAVEKARLSFSPLFGGGSIYGSGEDSLFILDCFRAGLKVYSHPYVMGTCAKDSSSWFTGYNEKYMFDRGAWIACAFPGMKHLMKWYFLFRLKPRTELSLRKMIYYINWGIRAYPERVTYQQAVEAATLQNKQEGDAYARRNVEKESCIAADHCNADGIGGMRQ